MKHERGYRLVCVCSDCDGTGKIEVSNGEIECAECEGIGEVCVETLPRRELVAANDDRRAF